MAVALNTSYSYVYQQAASFSSSLFGTSGAAALSVLVVVAGIGNTVSSFDLSATWNGAAMLPCGPVNFVSLAASSLSYAVKAFYVYGYPAGNYPVTISGKVNSGTIFEYYANVFEFSGANLSSPIRSGSFQTFNSTTGNTGSVTIPSSVNDVTLEIAGGPVSQGSLISSQTGFDTAVDGTYSAFSDSKSGFSAASITDTYTSANPQNLGRAITGFSIQPPTSYAIDDYGMTISFGGPW